MRLKPLFIIWSIFLLSRIFILLFPPPHYSDVKQDYERYANTWWYGMEPYLEHYFEYPPATIPLVITPLFFDQIGWGKYYPNYRFQIFLIDLVTFYLITQALKRLKRSATKIYLAQGFYILAGVIAKDFYYDGIDLAFASTLAIGLMSLILLPQDKLGSRLCLWFFFWLSFGVKFLSLPLAPILFLIRRTSFKTEVIACALGCLLVWGAPIVWYRSSLQVAYVFHKDRPLKYSSFGSYLIEVTNAFTHTEHRILKAPDFAMSGPVSQKMNQIFGLVFPMSIVAVIGYWTLILSGLSWPIRGTRLYWLEIIKKGWHRFWGKPKAEEPVRWFSLTIKVALIYIATIFLSGKVFSQPFPIWLIPLVVLFPYQTITQQLQAFGSVLWVLIMFTTPWVRGSTTELLIGPFTGDVVVFTVRVLSLWTLWLTAGKLNPNPAKVFEPEMTFIIKLIHGDWQWFMPHLNLHLLNRSLWHQPEWIRFREKVKR